MQMGGLGISEAETPRLAPEAARRAPESGPVVPRPEIQQIQGTSPW
jgi:hypothetical protein